MNLQVEADEVRIDQVVFNLVNNAVKYALNSHEIYLITYLFERYYRADYGGIQYSGLGLGLYISSEIVKRHNGEIGVISELGQEVLSGLRYHYNEARFVK